MPQKELERLQSVNRFLKLKISKEEELQDIVTLAAEICGTPTALITLIGEDTQHIRFKQAFEFDTTPREYAFCDHVIRGEGVMVIPDAIDDSRFVSNPLVTGDPNIRFYAGTSLTTQDGLNLGSLCVIGQTPSTLDQEQQAMLMILARQVIQLLEFDASLDLLKEQFLMAKAEELKLRSFFDSCACAHLLLDPELKIIAYNRTMSHFISRHLQIRLAVGLSILPLVKSEQQQPFLEAFRSALLGKTTHLERHLVYGKEEYWWDATFEPAYGPDKDIIGVSYNGHDISQRVKDVHETQLKTERLERIAFVQSHELRRPVATIQGLLNLMAMEGELEHSAELLAMQQQADILDKKIQLIVKYTSDHINS